MRLRSTLPAALVLCALAAILPARAEHDIHSPNMSLVANWGLGRSYGAGSDVAFWGDLAVVGSYFDPGGFRLFDIGDPASPTLVSTFRCGDSYDVSVFGSLVFLSDDYPRTGEGCRAPYAPVAWIARGLGWEGLRIVSIADPASPVQVAAVSTPCGSHTNTIIPDLDHTDPTTGEASPRVLVYVQSYPLPTRGDAAACNAALHRKISIVEVPLNDPATASIVSSFEVTTDGCHDITVLIGERLAAAACGTVTEIWDVSDPVLPERLSIIANPLISFNHSTAFSNDGDTLVIGDESYPLTGCDQADGAGAGALWFYDLHDPSDPILKSHFSVPLEAPGVYCSVHQFNIVPLRTDRDVLVSGWYSAGTWVIDFTDPASPVALGHYVALHGVRSDSWSSFWYNGYIYVNNLYDEFGEGVGGSRGFDVLRIEDPFVADAVRLPSMNAQTQEPVPSA